MRIEDVFPQDDHVLLIKAEGGQTGLFDVKPYLDGPAFEPLKKNDEFRRLHNCKYFIEWDCGADLSADTIEARWQVIASADAEQNATANG